MDAGLPGYGDSFDVFLADAKVGSPDGDGDSSPQGSKTRDDLDVEIQRWGRGWVFIRRRDFKWI